MYITYYILRAIFLFQNTTTVTTTAFIISSPHTHAQFITQKTIPIIFLQCKISISLFRKYYYVYMYNIYRSIYIFQVIFTITYNIEHSYFKTHIFLTSFEYTQSIQIHIKKQQQRYNNTTAM